MGVKNVTDEPMNGRTDKAFLGVGYDMALHFIWMLPALIVPRHGRRPARPALWGTNPRPRWWWTGLSLWDLWLEVRCQIWWRLKLATCKLQAQMISQINHKIFAQNPPWKALEFGSFSPSGTLGAPTPTPTATASVKRHQRVAVAAGSSSTATSQAGVLQWWCQLWSQWWCHCQWPPTKQVSCNHIHLGSPDAHVSTPFVTGLFASK